MKLKIQTIFQKFQNKSYKNFNLYFYYENNTIVLKVKLNTLVTF